MLLDSAGRVEEALAKYKELIGKALPLLPELHAVSSQKLRERLEIYMKRAEELLSVIAAASNGKSAESEAWTAEKANDFSVDVVDQSSLVEDKLSEVGENTSPPSEDAPHPPANGTASAQKQASRHRGLSLLEEEKPFLFCPLTLELFKHPVITPYGHTFEREALQDALAVEEKCPLTREPLKMEDVVPNRALQEAAEEARRAI